MSGIQLSGLINGSFDWQSVVSQLIAIDSGPITTLQNAEAADNTQLTAFAQLTGDVTNLQASVTALQAPGLFDGVTATSTTSGSTWTPTADSTTAPGNYSIDVTNLATSTTLDGASDIGTPLSATNDVASLTLATLPTATAPTAGTFTVDGKQVTVTLTESLQQVFDAISTATGGNVTGSYNPGPGTGADEVTLTSGNGSPIVLGAANDTSNLLSALKLENNGTHLITSSTKLGAAAINSPLTSAALSTPVTGTDSSGNGSFTINGVSISYNVNTSTISSVISSINNSSAGVTANYDPSSDSVTLTNNSTGDTGIGVADTSGTLMASLGLTTGATLNQGENAVFTINGGAPITSASNSLDPTTTGIAGLTVGVDSETTQTINVAPNTGDMSTAINTFITAYNQLQNDITSLTQITTNVNGTVTTAALANNQEVSQWSEDLRNLAFNSVSGLSGAITSLNDLGIGFSGTSPTLSVTDQTTLTNALATNPSAVGAFFQTPVTGFAGTFSTYLFNLSFPNTGGIAIETNALNAQNTTDADKISTLQNQLNQEQTNLTNEFLAMQNAQAQSEQEEQILSEMYGGSGSSSSSSSSSSAPADASVVPSPSTSTSTTSGSTTTA
jgi:flagellar hook-associated protein 2